MSSAARYQRGQVLRVQIQGHRDPIDMVCIERPKMFCGGGLMLMMDRCDGEVDRALEAINLYAKEQTSDRSDEAPDCGHGPSNWSAADEAMRWLNDVEIVQGGANGPTIKLRAAISALIAQLNPACPPFAEHKEQP